MSDTRSISVASHLSGLGDVAALEARVAAHFDMRYGVAMASATTGLMTLGMALNIGGQEFVTTPLTYGGTLAGWLALGARPRFADIDAESLTLSPDAVASAVTDDTRAILAVDLFGQPCDDEALRREADRCGAWLVVDAAQSLGARRSGRASGAAADAVVVSFTAGKALDVGEGGAVVTNNRDIYERLIWHSQHPYRQQRELGLRRVNEFALNGRIHPLAARAARRGFDRALGHVRRQQEWGRTIVKRLTDLDGIDVPHIDEAVAPSYYRLTLRGSGPARRRAVSALAADGIRATAGDIPASILYRHGQFQSRPLPGRCRIAERECRTRFCVLSDVSFSPRAKAVDHGLTRG